MTETLNLENCDREPIHTPGSIQPHGALLAFDRLGRLSHVSANAATLLKRPLPLGQVVLPGELHADDAVHALIKGVMADAADEDVPPASAEARIGGQCFDVVVHSTGGTTVCEFELRADAADEPGSFAHKAYRSMDRIKRRRTLPRLLEAAVDEIRALTGFDRVMAYRFRHDDSGDVVAESHAESLDPYLGRRYPASDIPAQARRLYTLNTLRLIADLTYQPVPILAEAAAAEPLDLSHSTLRSVSPIHVEYLRNMGVAASMSVSIVVAGKLWGMIACHHMAPRQVPYSVRMAADVIAQLLASSVQSLAAQAREATMARAAWLRTEIVARTTAGGDVVEALQEHAAALTDNLGCDAMIAALDGKYQSVGLIDPVWTDALLAWLGGVDTPAVVNRTRVDDLGLPPIGTEAPSYCGVLALRFDGPRQGWLIGLRREQIETIRWGGKPDKEISHGPLGPRLTPRGSFAEWRETVRGAAEPWDATQIEIASQLLNTVARVHADRVVELDRLRSRLWAVLGHDLRNPMQSLTMAAQVLDRGNANNDRMSSVIKNSTGRMERLIGDVLDISRLQNGLGLGLRVEPVDLVQMVSQLIEEVQVAHPGTWISSRAPERLVAEVDPGRFAQVVANLLSNARHHGEPGTIALRLRQDQDDAVIEVTNGAPPIPPELVDGLFDPFKRDSLGNSRNPSGMGLGLYIANQVVQGHGGRISYRPGPGTVTFDVRIPLTAPGRPRADENARH